MCGPQPCSPMHASCTWSPEHKTACLTRYREAQRLLALRASDWDAAVRSLHAYDKAHGSAAGQLLRAEIKRLNRENNPMEVQP